MFSLFNCILVQGQNLVLKIHTIWRVLTGTEFAIGPFEGGIDLRPLMFLTRFPTVLIFASESGMAVARSLIEAVDVGTLYLNMREDVRLYCSATTPSELAYQVSHFAFSSCGGWIVGQLAQMRTTVFVLVR